MHLGHFRSCSLSCVCRNPALLKLYRTWEFLLHGLDKYAERAAGRLQTATHIDFAREVKVSNAISYRYSMSEQVPKLSIEVSRHFPRWKV